jgi:DNA repair protein RecO (recombination protein O)
MRISAQPAWVLHLRPWRETSALVELFTHEYGRIAAIARGLRGPRQQPLRAALQAFTPLRIAFHQSGELATLGAVEATAAALPLAGDAVLAGLYLNELLLRLTARGDPCAALFVRYSAALDELAQANALARISHTPPTAAADTLGLTRSAPSAGLNVESATSSPVFSPPSAPDRRLDALATDGCEKGGLAWTLRRFERDLLAELGYALACDCDEDGEPLDPQAGYWVDPERGARRAAPGQEGDVRGAALLALAHDRAPDAAALRSLRRLLRSHIGRLLDGRPLRSWDLLGELADARRPSA